MSTELDKHLYMYLMAVSRGVLYLEPLASQITTTVIVYSTHPYLQSVDILVQVNRVLPRHYILQGRSTLLV